MTQKQIRVGIVGANAQRSWANISHVPAINGLAGLRLAAVATRNEQSAREAAEAFGADRWFSDPLAMIDDDRIDVITISVICSGTPRTCFGGIECWQSGLLRGASRTHCRGS
jgi:predicted dehydrogenase